MRLSTFTDYSLRVLMSLGSDADRLMTISEIATCYSISENHLMKVVHQLGRAGYVETLRGKGGGIRLARLPEDINLGEIIRQTETDFDLVECFSPGSKCRLQSTCRLQSVLGEAVEALFKVLDAYTLADLLDHSGQLAQAIGLVNPVCTERSRRSDNPKATT